MSERPEEKSQEGDVVVEIHIADVDRRALYDRARQSFQEKGATEEEVHAFLGTPDNINYDACVREIIYPTKLADVSGKIRIDAAYVPDNLPLLRRSNILHTSTGNITQEELQAIEEAFGAINQNQRRSCYEHVQHGPLYLSPKDYGFYVRIPEEVTASPQWIDVTPEMRAIVEAAIRQGAAIIEFDADEHPTDNLYFIDQ